MHLVAVQFHSFSLSFYENYAYQILIPGLMSQMPRICMTQQNRFIRHMLYLRKYLHESIYFLTQKETSLLIMLTS